MKAQPRRQHLIDTAFKLFNEHGYHATGIDWILQESGVSKATLYKYFRSKEELILAVLKQRHDELAELNSQYMKKAVENGKPTSLVIFDALHDWFQSKAFFGCNFIKASGEYAQADDAIHAYAASHKEAVRNVLESQLPIANKNKAALLADQLMILVEGAIISAHVRGDKNAARNAKNAAEILLNAASNI